MPALVARGVDDTVRQTTITACACLAAWADYMQACGLAAATIAVRVRVLRALLAWSGVRCARELTPAELTAYLAEHDLATWSRRKYLEHARAFATWAGSPDPTSGLVAPRQPRGAPRPISEHDLELLLESARRVDALVGEHARAPWVLLGAYCGLRSAEVAGLRAEDVVDGPALRVRGKGGRVDVVPVPPVVALALAPVAAGRTAGQLWPGLRPDTVQRGIRRAGALVGVAVTSHQLRHRYGTALYRASRDLLLVQRLMRHESPTTTAGYARIDDAAAVQLALQLPGAGVVV